MTVQQLIDKLQALPDHVKKATLQKSSIEGCGDCNPECLEHFNDVYGPTVYGPNSAPYPYSDNKETIVVL